MAKLTIKVDAREEGSLKFFVFRDPQTGKVIEVSSSAVPAALGDMGVQLENELKLALVKLAGLPALSKYQFVLSDSASALAEEVYEISSLVFGDEVSEAAWNAALEQK